MTIKNVICDIDGVLMHDNVAVPGAAEFLHRIIDKGMPLVLLTNYPSQTGQDLANRFATAGVDVPDSVFYTSAMATADFLKRQEGKKAYVVGEGAALFECSFAQRVIPGHGQAFGDLHGAGIARIQHMLHAPNFVNGREVSGFQPRHGLQHFQQRARQLLHGPCGGDGFGQMVEKFAHTPEIMRCRASIDRGGL